MYQTQLDISNFSGLDDSILDKYSNVISKSTLLSTAPVKTTLAVNPNLKPQLQTVAGTTTTTSRPPLAAPTTYTAPAPAPAPTTTVSEAPKMAINPDLKPLATATYTSTPQVLQPIAQPVLQPVLQPVIPVAPIGQAIMQPIAQPSVISGGGYSGGGYSGGGYSGGGYSGGGDTSGGDMGGAEDGTGEAGTGGAAKKVAVIEDKSNKMKMLGLLIGAAGGYFYSKQNNKSLVAFTLIGSVLGLGIGYYIEKNK